MAGVRHHWFDLKLVASVADVVLKISAALGILLGVSLHLFRADVRLDALDGRINPFFQAELDPSIVRDEHAKLGRPVPLAVEVLVRDYNRDNEADLKEMRDSTVATDVRLRAPPGYFFVGSDDEQFSLQPGRTAVRRMETHRGDPPQTIDRTVGVQWDTGKGFVPGGRTTVLAACAVVVLAIAYALLRDWLSFCRQREPEVEPPMEPPVA